MQLKTSVSQREALRRYARTRKGRASRAKYRASEKGRAARARYLASEKGRAALERSQAKARGRYAREARAAQSEAERLDLRRRRIAMGLPPDSPEYRGRGTFEEATAEAMRPEYIAAALALEDLRFGSPETRAPKSAPLSAAALKELLSSIGLKA